MFSSDLEMKMFGAVGEGKDEPPPPRPFCGNGVAQPGAGLRNLALRENLGVHVPAPISRLKICFIRYSARCQSADSIDNDANVFRRWVFLTVNGTGK